VRAIVAGLLLLAASVCRGDVTPLIFSPSNPNSRDQIIATSSTRLCEFFALQVGGEIQGNTVRITGRGLVRRSSELCLFGINAFTVRVGVLPAGNYNVEIYIIDETGFGTFLVRTDPIIVVEAPPLQAPAFSSWSLLALLLGVIGIGWYAGRRG
jgi:hypothetical protein